MPKGSSKSTAVIQRLLEERRQYEAWIARLNNAADATPGHVRARVRADYEARLTAVIEELKAHGESAREAIDQKKQLRAELQKKEALAADKMTETELRHAVGEYDEAHWSQVHKDVLAELVSVREDLQAVEADIQKLEELDTLVGTQPVGAAPRGGLAATRPASPRAPYPPPPPHSSAQPPCRQARGAIPPNPRGRAGVHQVRDGGRDDGTLGPAREWRPVSARSPGRHAPDSAADSRAGGARAGP